MLVNDHVVTDYLCNLRCEYCPCEVTLMKRRGDLLFIGTGPGRPAIEETVSQFLDRNIEIIALAASQKPTPVLKLSGGEIFLIPEFLDRLPALAKGYAVVQILTNGTRLDRNVVTALKAIDNVHLQVSLDGHTLSMNHYRFKGGRILESILQGLAMASDAGIPLEVNTVLSKVNTEAFFDFVLYTKNTIGRCTIYPFPVRGNPGIFPSPEQVDAFVARFHSAYPSLRPFLPPLAYMKALNTFLATGVRTVGCHVPDAVMGSHGDGMLEACTCGPVKTLGNVLGPNGIETYGRVGADPCYEATRHISTSPACCNDCFTHYDIINLFIEGDISIDELERLPFFAVPDVLQQIVALRRSSTASEERSLRV